MIFKPSVCHHRMVYSPFMCCHCRIICQSLCCHRSNLAMFVPSSFDHHALFVPSLYDHHALFVPSLYDPHAIFMLSLYNHLTIFVLSSFNYRATVSTLCRHCAIFVPSTTIFSPSLCCHCMSTDNLCAVILIVRIVPSLCRHRAFFVPSSYDPCAIFVLSSYDHRAFFVPTLSIHCDLYASTLENHYCVFFLTMLQFKSNNTTPSHTLLFYMLFILSLNCSLFLSLDLDHMEAQLADRGLDTEQVQQELDTISFTFKEKIHHLQTQLAGAERQNLDLQESLRYAGTMLETMKEESKMKDGEIVKLREEFMTELKDERRYLDQFHKAIKFIARKIVCVAIVILYCKKDKTDDGTLHFFFFALPSNLLSTVTALSLIPSSSLNPTTSTTWPSP